VLSPHLWVKLKNSSPRLNSVSSPAHCLLCQSVARLQLGMAQYRGLAAEGRHRYVKYINIEKYEEINILTLALLLPDKKFSSDSCPVSLTVILQYVYVLRC
jgi:prepilin signal peptidase PulO-like enzyme (type II secretory pathway)